MTFETEQHAIEWVQNNIPLLIKPKKEGKYTFICPFTSVHAFKIVVEQLGKELYKLTQTQTP